MFKMNVYKAENRDFFRTEKSDNLEYFNRYKGRENYKIEIFQKIKNRWRLMYIEY